MRERKGEGRDGGGGKVGERTRRKASGGRGRRGEGERARGEIVIAGNASICQ